MQDYSDYTAILDEVMEKWLGPALTDYDDVSAPYRMMALLLDDPSNKIDLDRRYIVDINKPEIRRKLDMLNGPYFNTIMKMLELRMFNEDCERNNTRTEDSSRTMV